MSIKDLELNTTLKLVGLTPLKLAGYCRNYTPTYQEHHFTITEVGNGYELTAADGSKEYFQTLKEALQQCFLNWGEYRSLD